MNFSELELAVEQLIPTLSPEGLVLVQLFIPFCKGQHLEIQQLRSENSILVAENISLRAENISLRAENISLRAENAILNSEILDLKSIIIGLETKVKQLQDQIAQNSRNSSKPPSQDAFRSPKDRSLRQKSGKKVGGQKGHKGQGGYVKENPDEIIKYEVLACPDCKVSLAQEAVVELLKRQVEDIPPIQSYVVEHQIEVKKCPCCNVHWQACGHPADVLHAHQYGANVKAFALLLSARHMIPCARLKEILGVLGLKHISLGTLDNFRKDASRILLQRFIPSLKQRIIESESAHFDETGSKVNGVNFWIHTACTTLLSFFAINVKRGEKAMSAMDILTKFKGIGHHDCFGAYGLFTNFVHSLCNAHILRELKGVMSRETTNSDWARSLINVLLEAKKLVAASKQCIISKEEQNKIRTEYMKFLAIGLALNPALERPPEKQRGKVKQSKTHNLLIRMEKQVDSFLRFTTNPNAKFDNNQAERDIRMNKVKMKVSGCYRSVAAAEEFMNLRSFIATAIKQGMCPRDMLISLFTPNCNDYMKMVYTPE